VSEDFEIFDYIIAMDRANLADLRRMAPSDVAVRKIELLRSFDFESPRDAEVPDPYYGEGDGFERVLDICEAACRGLLEHIRARHGL
jgi:protein-tyrosine phosphatase